MKIRWKLLALFYSIIRPLFVKEVDSNEDYECGYCRKPVLKRYLFCSEECSAKDNIA